MVEKVKKNRDRKFNSKILNPSVKKLEQKMNSDLGSPQLFELLYATRDIKEKIEEHSPDLVGFKRIYDRLTRIERNTVNRINEGVKWWFWKYVDFLERLQEKVIAGEKHISSLDALFHFKKHAFIHSGPEECESRDAIVDKMYRFKEAIKKEIFDQRPDLKTEECQK